MKREEILSQVKQVRQIAQNLLTENNVPAVFFNFKIIYDYAFLCEFLLGEPYAFCPEDARKNSVDI